MLHVSTPQFISDLVPPNATADCGTPEEDCSRSTQDLILVIVQALLVVFVIFVYTVNLRRSLADHSRLPYSHYRLTNMYLKISVRSAYANAFVTACFLGIVCDFCIQYFEVKVRNCSFCMPPLQKRHTTVLLLALAFGLIMVDASVQGACLGNVNVNIGSITSNLALAVYAVASAVLYMPSTTATVPAQALQQEFAWTEDQLETLTKERANVAGAKGPADKNATALLMRMLSGPLLNLVVNENSANRQVAKARMFCMETAVKLYYWARYAYQHDVSFFVCYFLSCGMLRCFRKRTGCS